MFVTLSPRTQNSIETWLGQPGRDGKTESIRAGTRDEQDHRVTITKREENSSTRPDHDGPFAGLLPAYVENLRLVRVEVTGIPVALCGAGPVLLRWGERGGWHGLRTTRETAEVTPMKILRRVCALLIATGLAMPARFGCA